MTCFNCIAVCLRFFAHHALSRVHVPALNSGKVRSVNLRRSLVVVAKPRQVAFFAFSLRLNAFLHQLLGFISAHFLRRPTTNQRLKARVGHIDRNRLSGPLDARPPIANALTL